MKGSFAPWVERCRADGEPGESYGAFRISGPLGMTLLCVVSDGKDWPLGGEAWEHVSVSLKNRTPTWAELDFVKRTFFKDDEWAMQLHAPVEQHINIHPHVLHLWRPKLSPIPVPPAACV